MLSATHRFIGVSLADEGLAELLERKPPAFEVVTGMSAGLLESYELGGTPRTMVIDSDGRISANYFGAYFGATARSIERELEVALPEVAAEGSY